MRERISYNAVANLAVTTFPILIGFFLTPFIVHQLGDSAYGIWALSLALLGFSGFLDLGLAPTVSKKTAEYIATSEKGELVATCSTILVLYSGLGLGVIIAFFLIAKFSFTSWFNIPPELEETARTALFILGVQAGIRFPLQLFHGIVQGMQKFGFRSAVISSTVILRALLIVAFLSKGYGLIALLLIDFGVQLLQSACFALYVFRRLPSFAIKFSQVHWVKVKELLGFSSQVFILQISALLILQSDKVIIGAFLPIAAVTIYEIGLKIHDVIRSLVASVQAVILPTASELSAINNVAGLQELLLRGSKYVLIIYLLLAVPAIIMAKPFIVWWMGEEYAQSALILQILLIGQMFNALNFVPGQIFVGMGVLKVYTRVRVASALFNIGVSIGLLHVIGLPGVALGTTIQFFLSDTPLLLYFLSKLRIPAKQYLKRCLLTTLPYAAVGGGLLMLYNSNSRCITEGSIAGILLGGVSYVVVFVGLLFLLGLDHKERNEICSLVKGMWRG